MGQMLTLCTGDHRLLSVQTRSSREVMLCKKITVSTQRLAEGEDWIRATNVVGLGDQAGPENH